MTPIPLFCVVDTNVCTTANSANTGAPADCVIASQQALAEVMAKSRVAIDDGQRLMKEYIRNLNLKGEPKPGTKFLKWLLTNEWNPAKVTRVRITEVPGDPDSFAELPKPADGTVFDASDRKFLAVSVAHPEHPPLLQSFDSKWFGWEAALAKHGVKIVFLCPDAIQAKHASKMGK